MTTLSDEELFKMAIIYAESGTNSHTAQEFGRRIPNSSKVNRLFIHMLIICLKTEASLQPRLEQGRNSQYSDN